MGAGRVPVGPKTSLAGTPFFYAPRASKAPRLALPGGLHKGQTGLALFFFLRLGG